MSRMRTVYYPHYDLESKGLLHNCNHTLNIKLLLLLFDRVLLQPSHLLEIPVTALATLKFHFGDFIADGKIVASIHAEQNGLDDFYCDKLDKLALRNYDVDSIYDKSRFVINELFQTPNSVFKRDYTNKERGLFSAVFNDFTENSIALAPKSRLGNSADKLRRRVRSVGDTGDDFLAVSDVLRDMAKNKAIPKTNIDVIYRDIISAYYYCGSLANEAVAAYNPFFLKARYDAASKSIPYRSGEALDPEFLLRVLRALNIIDSPGDLLKLDSIDYSEIKKHDAWLDFYDYFSKLYNQVTLFEYILYREKDTQQRISRIKRVLYGLVYGVSDLAFSNAVGFALNGYAGIAFGVILMAFGVLFMESRLSQKIQRYTTDNFIENIVRAREPMYVMTTRLKDRLDKVL